MARTFGRLIVAAALACAVAAAQRNAESTPIELALLRLDRLPSDARLHTYGVASGSVLKIVLEIAAAEIARGRWTTGAGVQVTATGAGGASATATGQIEPGARSVVIAIPHKDLGPGPWSIAVRVKQGDLQIDERLVVDPGESTPLLDAAIVFRGTASPLVALQPVADFHFKRTERLHVEWPLPAALDRRTSRLLDRRGQPIALAASGAERDAGGTAVLAADIDLAPLNAGDYVLEVVAGRGADEQRALVAFRVVR